MTAAQDCKKVTSQAGIIQFFEGGCHDLARFSRDIRRHTCEQIFYITLECNDLASFGLGMAMAIDDENKADFMFALLLHGNQQSDNRGQSYVMYGEDPEAGRKLKRRLGGLISVSMLNGQYLPPAKIVQGGARISRMTRRS
ncbi:MAG: hypothetical protein ABFS18_08435 [Thermodesulfobacteriota bacterium]